MAGCLNNWDLVSTGMQTKTDPGCQGLGLWLYLHPVLQGVRHRQESRTRTAGSKLFDLCSLLVIFFVETP